MFDDLFETEIREGENDPVIDRICNDIFDSSRDLYAEEEFYRSGQLIYRPPPLTEVWLDERGRREQNEKLGKQRLRREQRMRVKNNSVPNQPIILIHPKDDLPPDGAPISDDDSSDCDYFVEIPHS